MAQAPIRTKKGAVRIVDSSNFPAAKIIAAGLVEVEPGGMRELHWHPNSDELQYYIEDTGRMTVYASSSAAQTFDYQGGDVGYVPKSMPRTPALRNFAISSSGSPTFRGRIPGPMASIYVLRIG